MVPHVRNRLSVIRCTKPHEKLIRMNYFLRLLQYIALSYPFFHNDRIHNLQKVQLFEPHSNENYEGVFSPRPMNFTPKFCWSLHHKPNFFRTSGAHAPARILMHSKRLLKLFEMFGSLSEKVILVHLNGERWIQLACRCWWRGSGGIVRAATSTYYVYAYSVRRKGSGTRRDCEWQFPVLPHGVRGSGSRWRLFNSCKTLWALRHLNLLALKRRFLGLCLGDVWGSFGSKCSPHDQGPIRSKTINIEDHVARHKAIHVSEGADPIILIGFPRKSSIIIVKRRGDTIRNQKVDRKSKKLWIQKTRKIMKLTPLWSYSGEKLAPCGAEGIMKKGSFRSSTRQLGTWLSPYR